MITRTRPRRRLPSACLLALGLATLATACGSADAAEERVSRATRGSGDVVIAVVWPWAARSEVRYAEGLQMAVDEVNAGGGIHGRPLRLRREDDRESVNDGLLIAQRLAEDPDVVAVIGHLQSYISVPAAAIYDHAGLVMLAPLSTDPALTARGYSRTFRLTFTDEHTGAELADHARERGYERVGIYYVRNPYGRALANAFEERAAETGLRIAARASFDAQQEAVAVRTVAHDWARMKVDAVFLAGQVPLAGRIIQELRAAGLDVAFLGGDAMSSPALISVGGDAVEGVVVAATFHPAEPRAEVAAFVDAFRRRHGVEPDPASAVGYDAVRLLAEAMRRGGTAAPARVAEELHRLEGWSGVTGTIGFTSRGDLQSRNLMKLVVQGGEFRLLDAAAGTAITADGAGP